MATFLMFGSYTDQALKGVSADRTEKATKLVKKAGGSVKAVYALLGEHDLVLIVDLPGVESAMQVSLALHRLTGIGFSTAPALEVKEFDRLAAKKK